MVPSALRPVESSSSGALSVHREQAAASSLRSAQLDGLLVLGHDGIEAQRIGLVNRSVPSAQLMDAVMQMAAKIAANSSFSLKMIKKGLNMARGEASMEALMEFEVEACLACVSTKERQESLTQFEGRKKQ